ncbi:hypothetical protein [Chitinibacter sp. GC72]|uniref:hypothetical protein n=1 Tax=Chitinibacter sp. GC72 TaxID=1526917 RepID=UPI0012F8DA26|nr:hypothetical protein [Chitinibacter sp. GC72]
MHILSSQLQLSSAHEEQSERWLSSEIALSKQPSFSSLLAQVKAEIGSNPATPAAETEAALEAKRKRFQSLLALLFGDHSPCQAKPITPLPAPDLSNTGTAPATPQWLETTTRVHVRESESCSMNAVGKVCLADGSQRQFAVDYTLRREASYSSVSSTHSVLRDPLVLDFGAPGMALNQTRVNFDLDADGQVEALRLPQAELLFVDRNQNGKADDGTELFGAQSGNGFAELARLDRDGNGWLDSGDAAFEQLKLWHSGSDQVRSLHQAGVGAISVQSVATPFSEKAADVVLAQLRASGIWLGEQGGAGTVRQIDLNTDLDQPFTRDTAANLGGNPAPDQPTHFTHKT